MGLLSNVCFAVFPRSEEEDLLSTLSVIHFLYFLQCLILRAVGPH